MVQCGLCSWVIFNGLWHRLIKQIPNRILISVQNNFQEPLISIEILGFGGKIDIGSIQRLEPKNLSDQSIFMNRSREWWWVHASTIIK